MAEVLRAGPDDRPSPRGRRLRSSWLRKEGIEPKVIGEGLQEEIVRRRGDEVLRAVERIFERIGVETRADIVRRSSRLPNDTPVQRRVRDGAKRPTRPSVCNSELDGRCKAMSAANLVPLLDDLELACRPGPEVDPVAIGSLKPVVGQRVQAGEQDADGIGSRSHL